MAAVTGPLLEVTDLRVSFGPGREAVSGLTFSAARGETVALVGESGCGKSLSALALGGLLPAGAAVTGSALLDGVQLVGQPERRMRRLRGDRVGMVFQDASTALNPLMNVGAQIEEVMAIHGTGGGPPQGAGGRTARGGRGAGPGESRARSYPYQLSGGMRQRVMMAIALAGSPDLVIADEPRRLDVTVQAQVLALLRESTRDAAVLFITHDMGVVAGEIADRVVVMYAGCVVESGTIREVLERPRHPYTAALLASAEQALDLDGLLVDLVVRAPAPAASWVIEGYVEPASVSVCDTEVGSGSATSVVTLTPAHDMTADSTITPTIRPRKIIAGCGTLLPTRSIQPRKPPLPPESPVGSVSAVASLMLVLRPVP